MDGQCHEGKGEMQHEELIIDSKFSPLDGRPGIDLDQSFWSDTPRVIFDQAAFTRQPYPNSETQVVTRWTRSYLYFGFWCRYQTLNVYEGEDPHSERWGLWEKDVVEAFIAPDLEQPSHYFEFEVAPNNQWIDLEIDLTTRPFRHAPWSSGFEHVTSIDAASHSWASEWRIPVASLTASPIRPGDVWRINFYRTEGTAPDRRAMSWGALPRNLSENMFHQPESFGRLRFAPEHAAQRGQ